MYNIYIYIISLYTFRYQSKVPWGEKSQVPESISWPLNVAVVTHIYDSIKKRRRKRKSSALTWKNYIHN